ncbi:amino acid ABC transporter permease [Streptomyces sp. NPDC020607]|uniref:amino acid ABC transporter permease n=1 Tax=Streptomyces sp. NPDC020607 TaxID=3365082 RepID=UPI003791B340
MTDKFDKAADDTVGKTADDKTVEDTPPKAAPATTVVDKAPRPEAIRAIPVRHYGRWVSGVIVVALLAMLIYAFSQGDVKWDTVGDMLFDDRIVKGAGRTLLISVLSMIIGLVLGLVFAVMRMSKNPVTSGVAWLYIWFFRGTPVYVQLLLWFNLALIFPVFNIPFIYKDEMTDVMTPFVVALLGLGLNEGAYMAEIVRAGIQSVDHGQTEAAHALGMTSTKTTRRIVLPQAMRVILPPTGNEFINLLKTSSLVTVVTYVDLLRSATVIGSTSFAVMEMLFVASVWYLALTSVFSVGQFYLERRYAKGALRQLPDTPWQKVKANMLSLGRPQGGAA